MSGDVACISFDSTEVLRERLRAAAAPVLITDSVPEALRRESWSPARLLSVLGTRSVNLLCSETGKFDFTQEGERTYSNVRLPFEEALGRISAARLPAPCYYLRQLPLADYGLNEAGLPGQKLLPPATRREQRLWLASADCVTPLHYDGKNNLLTEMHGRKRVTLFPPSEHARMYPYGLRFQVSHLSRVDPEAIDEGMFPQFPSQLAVSFLLHPGQTLFIPAFWWHHVRALDLSVSVNEWWPVSDEQYLVPNAADYLRLKYRKERLARIFEDEGARRPLCFARLAARAHALGLNCAAILFCGAATRLTLDALAANDGATPADREGNDAPSREEAERAQALARRGRLTPHEAGRAQFCLFLAELAATQGKTPAAAELENITVEVSEFVARRCPNV